MPTNSGFAISDLPPRGTKPTQCCTLCSDSTLFTNKFTGRQEISDQHRCRGIGDQLEISNCPVGIVAHVSNVGSKLSFATSHKSAAYRSDSLPIDLVPPGKLPPVDLNIGGFFSSAVSAGKIIAYHLIFSCRHSNLPDYRKTIALVQPRSQSIAHLMGPTEICFGLPTSAAKQKRSEPAVGPTEWG